MCVMILNYFLILSGCVFPVHTDPRCQGFNYAGDVDNGGLCEVTDHVTYPDTRLEFNCYVRGKCLARDGRFWDRKINTIC